MRFVTYNIRHGLGRDGLIDLDRISEAVGEADVIALQEVERFWPRSGMLDQPLELAKRLPDHFWVFGPAIDLHTPAAGAGIDSGRRRQFGNMLLSREPILASAVLTLPRLRPPERSMARVAVEGIISTSRGPLRVYSVHLCYLSAPTRRLQLNALIDRHLQAPYHGGAWMGEHGNDADGWATGDEPDVPASAVILGDLNFTPDSEEYALVSGRRGLDPYGLVDAWRVRGGEEQDTFPGGGRIDYGLISRDLRSAVGAAWVDQTAEGSDHQPVWFTLDM